LETDINPENLKKTLAKGDFAKSLCMALRLNDNELIQLVAETIPSELGFTYTYC
jgi:hypothetical protein